MELGFWIPLLVNSGFQVLFYCLCRVELGFWTPLLLVRFRIPWSPILRRGSMTRYWISAAQSECRRENWKILQRRLPNNFPPHSLAPWLLWTSAKERVQSPGFRIPRAKFSLVCEKTLHRQSAPDSFLAGKRSRIAQSGVPYIGRCVAGWIVLPRVLS